MQHLHIICSSGRWCGRKPHHQRPTFIRHMQAWWWAGGSCAYDRGTGIIGKFQQDEQPLPVLEKIPPKITLRKLYSFRARTTMMHLLQVDAATLRQT